MINVADLLELSVEERAELYQFEKELEKITSAPRPVIPDSEINKIEAILTKFAQEMVERGRQQADKSNS